MEGAVADQVGKLATNYGEQRLCRLLAVREVGLGAGSNLKVVHV